MMSPSHFFILLIILLLIQGKGLEQIDEEEGDSDNEIGGSNNSRPPGTKKGNAFKFDELQQALNDAKTQAASDMESVQSTLEDVKTELEQVKSDMEVAKEETEEI